MLTLTSLDSNNSNYSLGPEITHTDFFGLRIFMSCVAISAEMNTNRNKLAKKCVRVSAFVCVCVCVFVCMCVCVCESVFQMHQQADH